MNLSDLKLEKSKPEVYINGRKVGHISSDSLTSLSLVDSQPSSAEFKPVSGSLSFSIQIEDNETRKRLEEFARKLLVEHALRARWIEDCMRSRVVPPIKGKITVGKIRWRGLELCFGPNDEFLGILQRRKILYGVDGNTYPKQQKKEGEK